MYNDSRTTEPNMPTTNGVVLFELKAPYTPRLNEVTFRAGDGGGGNNQSYDLGHIGNYHHQVSLTSYEDTLARVQPDRHREGLFEQTRDPVCTISENHTYIYNNSTYKHDVVILHLNNYVDSNGYDYHTVPSDHPLSQAANMFNDINHALLCIDTNRNRLTEPEKNCLRELKSKVLAFCQSIQQFKDAYDKVHLTDETLHPHAYDTAEENMQSNIADLRIFVSSHQKLICGMKRYAASNEKRYYWDLWNRRFDSMCREADCCCVQ